MSKYSKDELIKVYELIRLNPLITYEEIEKSFLPQKISANSIVKRLQRMNCIAIERDIDRATGKIRGSTKNCLRSPE
jgi:hypothetical protein